MEEVFSADKFFKVFLKYTKVNGKKHRFYAIEIRDVALVAPVTPEGELIMERHFRPVLNKTIYEFPAGYIEEGENSLQSAKRELEEETGYKAGRIRRLFKSYVSPGRSRQMVHFFLADRLGIGKLKPEDGEQIDGFVKVDLDKALKMIKNGEIRSMEATACLLFLAQNRHVFPCLK